ncbi:MAG TPA: tetratricopeptide repeat protein [Bacteroidales bacterium]|nr:tetratricopeptide repeat protein [Bacteroidales bacterium]
MLKLLNKIFIVLFIVGFAACKSTEIKQISHKGTSEAVDVKDNSDVFIDANKAKMLGNVEESRKLFEKALTINPYDAASMFELAKIHVNRKEFDVAAQYLQKAVEIEPENVYYLMLYGSLMQATEHFREAIQSYKKVIELKPGFPEYYDKLALAYLYNGQADEAIRVYNDLEEQVGITEELSIKKHSIYLQDGKVDQAANEIKKLIDAFPNESRYYSMLAELYMSEGRSEDALWAYNKVKEINPDDPYIDISLAEYYKSAGEDDKAFEFLKAGFLNKNLDIDSKIQILIRYYTANEIYDTYKAEAFELSEALVETHPTDPKAYSMYGDFLYQDNQYANARDAFKKVIELDDSKYVVWEQLLFAEAELKNNDSLLVESQMAIELFPEQPLPYLFAGSVYYQKKKWQDCVLVLEHGLFYVINNDAMLTQFFSYLGDAYYQLDDFQKSDEYYDKALKINPNNDYVLNNYAYYLSLRCEDLEKAAQMAKKATELKPSSSNMDTYAWVLFKLGYYDEAKLWLEKAIDAGAQNNAVIIEHYGDVLWKLGKKKEAIFQWEKAAEAGEGSKLLNKKVEAQNYFE